MEDLSGKTVRGYEIHERLGEGGFGVVYRAYQPAIKREVVVKAILPVYANNPDFIRSFEAEAQLIARLEHLHIVPLYDYWRGPEGAFLVMRWLRGGSLMDSLTHGPWSVSAASRLVDQMAGALAIAHRHNVIHQDIKPANILLDEEANAYLTDFGLARDLEQDLDLAVSTVSTSIRGSPAYISPEQIRRGVITTRADIYSLGVVLFEVICGHHPFDTANVVELLRHQLNTQLPSIAEYRPDLPVSLNLVLWRATAKDPDIRYATAIELADAFREAAADYHPEESAGPSGVRSSAAPAPSDTGIISLASIDALLAEPPNPYKGLRPFQEADTADFFGRDTLIDSLLKRLAETDEGHRFLAVVGPSGSGKSSAVKAGLIPAVRSGQLAGWEKWFVVEMTPGAQPVAELVHAVASVATVAHEALAVMLEQSGGLNRAVQTALSHSESELVLVIDQFEELFILVDDEAHRRHFLDLLHQALTAPDSRLRLIVTLRADFYDRPLLHAGFGAFMRQRTEVVLPMSTGELRQAIIGPAERVGLALEAGLVERIVHDVSEQPNALPLLQFTLAELYERRAQGNLTSGAYEAIGGVAGALAQRADELYHQTSQADHLIIEQIFLRLVMPGERTEDTRRRALQSELTSLDEEGRAQRVMETFGKYRLLTFDRDPATREPTVEIAHEALIQRWDRLRAWLSNNRDQLRLHRQLAAAVSDWLASDRDASFLATGVRLAQYELLGQSPTLATTPQERAYLRASLQRRRRARRLRQGLVVGLSLVALAMFTLAVIALDQRSRADRQTRIAQSRELAASSQVVADRSDLSVLLSLQALAVADTFEARSSLLTSLQRYPRLKTTLNGHTDWVRSVAYSPDGQRIISGGRDDTVRLWDVVQRRAIGEPLTEHTAWVNAVTFSRDGRLAASGAEDGSLIVWDLSAASPQAHRLEGHTGAVWSVAFSPDGRTLASAGADGTVQLWGVASGERIATGSGHQDIVYAVAFSPDGKTLASASADNAIRLWDAADLTPRAVLEGHSNWVFSLAFSPDGSLLASGSADMTIRVWDTHTGQPVGNPLRGHSNWVRTLQFTPDGRFIVAGDTDGLILFWDRATGRPVDGFATPGGTAVWSLAVSPADGDILSGGADSNALYLWDNQPAPTLGQRIAHQDEQILAVAADTGGAHLASAGGLRSDFSVKLWDVPAYNPQATLTGHEEQVTSLMFSPTMPYLASGSLDRSVILWDTTTGQLFKRLSAQDSVLSIAFRPDGHQMAVGENSGAVLLWDMQASPDDWASSDPPLKGHTDRVLSVAYTPDGKLLASGSRDGTIRLWDSAAGQPVGPPLTGHTDGILDLAFNPTGTLLASASRDMTIRLWSNSEGSWQPAGEPLVGHTNWVMSVAFSPDNRMLASASGDQTIILWDVETHRMLGKPFRGHTDWVNTLAFSSDGTTLYSGGRDGQLMMWFTGVSLWHDRACEIANRNLTPDERLRYLPESDDNSMVCLPHDLEVGG